MSLILRSAITWAFVPSTFPSRCSLVGSTTRWRSATIRQLSSSNSTTADVKLSVDDDAATTPPWSRDVLTEKKSKRNNANRLRQHVNPLARKFQQPTLLSDNWPRDVYEDCKTRPLALDIGSAKGGFLLSCASQKPSDYNYLGLEIRPTAVQFAQDRLKNNPEFQSLQGHLDFVGCNANVDLGRLLSLYQEATGIEAPLELVTIQFPDPHFKKSHQKRRVTTPELVNALPAFMPPGSKVFLQSDIQSVLDGMRETFREASTYFEDQVEDIAKYYPENIIGIPTEREVSVQNRDLPVFRALFIRTEAESPRTQ